MIQKILACGLFLIAMSQAQLTKVWSASAGSLENKNIYMYVVSDSHKIGTQTAYANSSGYFSYIKRDTVHILDLESFTEVLVEKIPYDSSASSSYVWLYKNLYADDDTWNFVISSYYSKTGTYVLNFYQNNVSVLKKELWDGYASFYREEDKLYMFIYAKQDSVIECYQIRSGLPSVSSIVSSQANGKIITNAQILSDAIYDVKGRKISGELYQNTDEFLKQTYLKKQ